MSGTESVCTQQCPTERMREMRKDKAQQPAPDFMPEEYAEDGAAPVPEVWRNAPGTEVAPEVDWTVVAQRFPSIGTIIEYARADLERQGITTAVDVFAETAQRAIEAESAEDILDETPTLGAEDFIDRPFTLHNVRFGLSDVRGGFPVYLIMEVSDHRSGKAGILTTGAMDIIAKAVALMRKGLLPVDCEVRQIGETARGFRPLKLVKAGAPTLKRR